MSYPNTSTVTNRHFWEFTYSAAELAKAAAKKAAYRAEREAWWIEAKAKVMKEIVEGGITVSESVAATYSNNTNAIRPQVMVKADLQSKLTECHNKILEHNRAARDYRGWVQALEANPPALVLNLKYDDWLYFFGDDAVLNPDDQSQEDE